MILARAFQAPPILKNTFGEGLMTSARCALFFCRSTEMKNKDAVNLRSLKRSLYARMLTDAENRQQVENTLKEEWDQDRNSALESRVDAWLGEHLNTQITEGRYPLTNLSLDVEKQWNDVWQDPHVTLALM